MLPYNGGISVLRLPAKHAAVGGVKKASLIPPILLPQEKLKAPDYVEKVQNLYSRTVADDSSNNEAFRLVILCCRKYQGQRYV